MSKDKVPPEEVRWGDLPEDVEVDTNEEVEEVEPADLDQLNRHLMNVAEEMDQAPLPEEETVGVGSDGQAEES